MKRLLSAPRIAAFLLSFMTLTLPLWAQATFDIQFYSRNGREHGVSFEGSFLTKYTSLEQFSELSARHREALKDYDLVPTLQYLFGPLTRRQMGGMQRGQNVSIDWERASLKDGRVLIPYRYEGTWLVSLDLLSRGTITLPVPYNKNDLLTDQWKRCTDRDPDHQTESFYWYFWDPSRPGCDHKEGQHYEKVDVKIGFQTPNTSETYPDYNQLLRSAGLENNFQLTFGFGYVEDPENPIPETDRDQGIREYRDFVADVRSRWGHQLTETPILRSEYRDTWGAGDVIIGRRFQGVLNGVTVTINIVAAAGVDQMELFAKSFAHDHDGFFAWLGHSRVGSGFDAQRFARMLANSPDYYSVTTDYQLVYWGGCNSYSYYTLPFFDFKARAAGDSDPTGTKGLDIIANALPSYFSLNAINSLITLENLLNWENRPSYQRMIDQLEREANRMGIDVLVAVLGDEDNLSE